MREVVERAMRNDREAFGVLVIQLSDRLYAIAMAILRDSHLAEDAFQSAMTNAWQHLPELRDPDRFEAWIRRLVVNACYAEARRRRAWSANVRVLPLEGPIGPDDILSVAELDALDRAFRRLTIEQRSVFILHHHVGLRLQEVADTLGVPPGTARSRLHYATKILRSALEAAAAGEVREGWTA